MKMSAEAWDSQPEPTHTQPAPTEESGDQTTLIPPSQALMKLDTSSAEPAPEPITPGGLGLKARRQLHKTLTRSGISESDLPHQLQDTVIKKSRKGKAGQIALRQLSGVQKSPAAQLARKLEHELSEGREDICEKLQASGGTNQSVLRVAELLESNPQFSLARAIVEAGADVAHVLDHYAKGALALKKMETVLNLYKQMPDLMRDIARHAIDKESACDICLGLGKVTGRANGKTLNSTCPRCGGSGKQLSTSEHKEFAVQKMLEISEMLPKKQGMNLNVNQAVQVNAGGSSDVLARLSKAADEIIYGRGVTTPIVDAEVVDE